MDKLKILQKIADGWEGTRISPFPVETNVGGATPLQKAWQSDPGHSGILRPGQTIGMTPTGSERGYDRYGNIKARSFFRGNDRIPGQYASNKFIHPGVGQLNQRGLELNRDMDADLIAGEYGYAPGSEAHEELRRYVHQRGQENVKGHLNNSKPVRKTFNFRYIDPATQKELSKLDNTFAQNGSKRRSDIG